MSSPRIAAFAAAAVCGLAGAASGAFDAASGLFPLDLASLGAASDTLLSADWARAFSSPEVQVGPLHLLATGLLRTVARALGLSHRLVMSVTVQVVTALAVFGLVRRVTGRSRPLLQAGAAMAAVAGGIGWSAYISGNPEELGIGLLWILAATVAARDKAVGAGLLLAAATGLKASGLLGLPLLLLAPTRRERVVGLLTCLAASAAAYIPFFAVGTVRTFEYSWLVTSDLWAAVIDGAFPWWMRVVQAAAIVLLGALVVSWAAPRSGAVWVAPGALVALRIVLDPHPQPYFWVPFEAAALVGAAAVVGVAGVPRAVMAAAGGYATLLARYLSFYPGTGLRLVAGAALVGLARGTDESLDPAPAGALGPGREQPVAGPNGTV